MSFSTKQSFMIYMDYTLSDAARTGYTFYGWDLTKSGNTYTFTAMWTKATSTVPYMLNGEDHKIGTTSIKEKEIKKQISEIKDFEQEKTTIKINGKEQKIKKTSVKLTDKQLCDMLANIYTDLSENDKYLENFDESQKDSLKEIANAIKGIETTGKNTIKISLYTKGISNKLIGTNVEIYSAKEKQTALITITKKDKNVYKYDISMKMTGVKANIVKGEAILEEEKQENGEKGKITLTAETSELMELGKAKIEIEYNVAYNQKIDEPNVENNVNVKDLSQTDMVGIMSKIMQKPLLGEFLSKGLFDHVEDKENENIQNDNISCACGNAPFGLRHSVRHDHDYYRSRFRDGR